MNKKIKFYIIGLIIISLFSGCTSREMKKAKEYMEASMYDEAILLLEIEIQDSPKNAEASYLLGKCYLQTSNHNKVEDSFKRAILLDTDFKNDISNIYFEKSLELYQEDNNRQANSYYEEGLKYNPSYKNDFAKQLFDYVSDYSEQTTATSKSISLFSTVDNISPNYKLKIANKTFVLAESFIDKGFIKEGFEYADFGIKFDSKHIKDVADLYFKHANDLLTIQNNPNECIRYFNRSMELNPAKKVEIGNIYYNQAKVFETNNEISLLLLFAKKSVDINNDYKSWYLELKEKYKLKIPTNGLVAYYPFNGNTNDESGNSHHGSDYGPALTFDRFGNSNSAYLFDGINDYINVSNHADFNFGTRNFTITAWIKTSSENSGRIVAKSNHNRDDGYQLGPSSGVLRFYLLDSNPVANSTKTVDDDVWHNIVAVRNDSKLRIYIDGVLEATARGVSGWNVSSNNTLKIGRRDGNEKTYFKGIIDEVRIYNRHLSDEEIKTFLE